MKDNGNPWSVEQRSDVGLFFAFQVGTRSRSHFYCVLALSRCFSIGAVDMDGHCATKVGTAALLGNVSPWAAYSRVCRPGTSSTGRLCFPRTSANFRRPGAHSCVLQSYDGTFHATGSYSGPPRLRLSLQPTHLDLDLAACPQPCTTPAYGTRYIYTLPSPPERPLFAVPGRRRSHNLENVRARQIRPSCMPTFCPSTPTSPRSNM